jgi:3-phosphoshikimate 1-carboxyvinyltransferase
LYSGLCLAITGSKSESNRALILRALYSNIELSNLSNSDDTKLLDAALSSTEQTVDIHHAGTAMRFLTAYFSAKEGSNRILTGSKRMKERPIRLLVEALKSMGADIEYLEKEGYPPLQIKGSHLNSNYVELESHVSSQYISALLLLAPSLPKGLSICLLGSITSRPYIEMTLALLRRIGVETSFKENIIQVNPLNRLRTPIHLVIESDWSSASYFYSLVALSELGTSVELEHYFQDSLQGDAALQEIYKSFGVHTTFTRTGLLLQKVSKPVISDFKYDLTNAPDIAQTIAVTCFGLGLSCNLTGLHTLKIKETDRLEALRAELSKIGADILVTSDTLHLKAARLFCANQSIETYNDHRMAMAFAPLALKGAIQIKDPDVVSKSYPDFWKDLQTLGIVMK